MAKSVKVVLTDEELLECRTALIMRLHVERVNHGPRDAMLTALLQKLGWVEPERIVTPPEGEGRG